MRKSKPSKSSNTLKYTLIAALMLIIVVAAAIFGSNKKTPKEVGELDELAKCITSKGAVMYGTEWCSHCQNQKNMFGASFEHIKYVDCDKSLAYAGLKG